MISCLRSTTHICSTIILVCVPTQAANDLVFCVSQMNSFCLNTKRLNEKELCGGGGGGRRRPPRRRRRKFFFTKVFYGFGPGTKQKARKQMVCGFLCIFDFWKETSGGAAGENIFYEKSFLAGKMFLAKNYPTMKQPPIKTNAFLDFDDFCSPRAGQPASPSDFSN